GLIRNNDDVVRRNLRTVDVCKLRDASNQALGDCACLRNREDVEKVIRSSLTKPCAMVSIKAEVVFPPQNQVIVRQRVTKRRTDIRVSVVLIHLCSTQVRKRRWIRA